jgi:putative tricarboxylic transport membrane protein
MARPAPREQLRGLLPYLAMLVAAAFFYWAATRIEVDTGGRIGPAFWPKTVIALLALLCIYELVKRLVLRSNFSASGLVDTTNPQGSEVELEAAERPHPRKLAAGIGLVAAYVFAAPWLGFFVSTALFLAIFPWIGGIRRPWLLAALGAGGSLALIVVFMRVAYISLPLGEGPFRALSIGLLRLLGVT